MFITYDTYLSVPNLSILGVQGLQSWNCIDFDLAIPYFLLEYSVEEAGLDHKMQKLIFGADYLKSICDQIGNALSKKVLHVSIMSPPWMNNSERWEIDELVGILQVKIGESELNRHIYALINGKQLADFNISDGPIKSENSIFSIRNYID